MPSVENIRFMGLFVKTLSVIGENLTEGGHGNENNQI